MITVNKPLKKLLIDRNMSLKELAKLVDVTPEYLSQIVRGVEDGYRLREKIARVLNVSYDSLWMTNNDGNKAV